MSTTLLLISQLPEDRAFATAVAKEADFQLEQVPSAEKAIPVIKAREPKVIFVDVSSQELYMAFEKGVQENFGMFSTQVQPNNLHFLTSGNIDQVPYLIQSPIFGSLVMRRFDNLEVCASHYARLVRANLLERAWGLDKFLKPGTKVQTVKLVSTDQKQSAVDAIKNYLISAKFQSRMAALVANAIDEILMNAMFDAPTDNLGQQLYLKTSRATSFKLEGKHSVELQVGFDGQYVGITAIDHFGSLDKTKLLSHVSKRYTDEEYRVKTSVEGAGIGLATVYRTGGSFLFTSEARERTEVTVFFQRMDSYRAFREQFRFFSTQFYF